MMATIPTAPKIIFLFKGYGKRNSTPRYINIRSIPLQISNMSKMATPFLVRCVQGLTGFSIHPIDSDGDKILIHFVTDAVRKLVSGLSIFLPGINNIA